MDSKTCFLKTEGSECALYKSLGVILRLFSRLSKLFIALLSRKRAAKLRVSERVKACLHTKRTKQFRAAKRRHRDSRFKQSFAFRSLCFRRCCLYAANSGTGQLAVHVSHTTQFPNAQTFPVLFPRLPLTTTHAHTVPFFRGLLLLFFFIAKVFS